jgi:hypothetical protein
MLIYMYAHLSLQMCVCTLLRKARPVDFEIDKCEESTHANMILKMA